MFAVGAKTLHERHFDNHSRLLLLFLTALVSIFGQRWIPDRLLTTLDNLNRLQQGDLQCLLCRPRRASLRGPQLRMVAELQVGADHWESLQRIHAVVRQADPMARRLPEDALRHIPLPDVTAKEPGAESTRGTGVASQHRQASMKTKSVIG